MLDYIWQMQILLVVVIVDVICFSLVILSLPSTSVSHVALVFCSLQYTRLGGGREVECQAGL
jgi:uncharacterized membrane protein